MLAQNAPFTPIHDAWQAQSPTLLTLPVEAAARQLAELGAFVLGNTAPPYAIPGGIREALVETGGRTYAVTNRQMGNAMSVFAELEGISIEPAAGVAVASLALATAAGDLDRDAIVLLHVTGGGRRALTADEVTDAQPTLVLSRTELATTALERTRALMG
jgi:cysteate synthase